MVCLFSDGESWASICGVIGLRVLRNGRELVLPHRLRRGDSEKQRIPSVSSTSPRFDYWIMQSPGDK